MKLAQQGHRRRIQFAGLNARTGITADKLPGDNTPKEQSERKNYEKNCDLSVCLHGKLRNYRIFWQGNEERSAIQETAPIILGLIEWAYCSPSR